MGLANRIIPTILCRGRELVKGKQFVNDRRVGVAAQAVRIHAMRGVDEVVLLDINATREGRGPDLALVEELSEVLFAPLAVGGGIRSLQHVRDLLRAGADKVVIGTGAMEIPDLVRRCAEALGGQGIVVSVDALATESIYYAMKRCGQQARDTTTSAIEWAMECEKNGAGEILLQSIDRDGAMQGYDLELIRSVSRAVSIPVIASGGCGSYEHMREALAAGASAVAAGALFQFTDCTPKGAARYLASRGVEVRI